MAEAHYEATYLVETPLPLEAVAEVMAGERSRVFARINELSVDDGEHAEVARYLAGAFPTPGTLLGGPDADGAR